MPPSSRPGRTTATTSLGAAAMRVRWDRVGRVALLLLLLAVAALYVQPARSYLTTWKDSNAKQEQLHELERQHEQLVRHARELHDPRTLETEARRLGMVRPGERSYVIGGLPDD
jgi:cell division protein FtsB